jgi:hypothetical protein
MPSGSGSGAGDMACAEVARAKAKATAINLIISPLLNCTASVRGIPLYEVILTILAWQFLVARL